MRPQNFGHVTRVMDVAAAGVTDMEYVLTAVQQAPNLGTDEGWFWFSGEVQGNLQVRSGSTGRSRGDPMVIQRVLTTWMYQ